MINLTKSFISVQKRQQIDLPHPKSVHQLGKVDQSYSLITVQQHNNVDLPRFPKSKPNDAQPDPMKTNIFEITNNAAIMLLPRAIIKSSVSKITLSLLVDSDSSVSQLKHSCMKRHRKLLKETIRLKGIGSTE